MKIFAERLKKAREFEGYTQEKFAEILGIPLNTYRKYEMLSPKWHSEPNQELQVKMAEILKVSTDYLLGLAEI